VSQTVELPRVAGPKRRPRWPLERDRTKRQPQHLRSRRDDAGPRDPGVTLDQGYAFADRIHSGGLAIVWSGHREAAEHYWELCAPPG